MTDQALQVAAVRMILVGKIRDHIRWKYAQPGAKEPNLADMLSEIREYLANKESNKKDRDAMDIGNVTDKDRKNKTQKKETTDSDKNVSNVEWVPNDWYGWGWYPWYQNWSPPQIDQTQDWGGRDQDWKDAQYYNLNAS